jgi:hypothetical protein
VVSSRAESGETFAVTAGEVEGLMKIWGGASPNLKHIADEIAQLEFTHLRTSRFTASVGHHAALVDMMGRAAREGTAVAAALATTLRVVMLKYEHADGAAKEAYLRLLPQLEVLRGGVP